MEKTRIIECRNLKAHSSAQCHVQVIESDEHGLGLNFVSYHTTVLKVRGMYIIPCGQYWRKNNELYTPTTARQIGWFLQEYFPTLKYFDFRCAAEQNKRLSLYTGCTIGWGKEDEIKDRDMLGAVDELDLDDYTEIFNALDRSDI